jgi:nucleotide-binding universal stress UspA family protein
LTEIKLRAGRRPLEAKLDPRARTMRYPVFAGFMAPQERTATLPPAVTAAHSLAGLLGGSLSLAVAAIEIKTPVVFSRANVGGLIAAENKRSRETAEAVCQAIKNDPRFAGASTDMIHGELPVLRRTMASRARLHAFTVTEAGVPGDLMQSAIVETLLFESGRPVLVVPRGHGEALAPGTVLIAWDGGETAARATWNALPLLAHAKRAVIVSVTGEKDLGGRLLGTDIAKTLASTGIDVEARTLPLAKPTVAEVLTSTAREIGAGLIVVGAYGHSRWREFVFGGVTRALLRDSQLPLLMSN